MSRFQRARIRGLLAVIGCLVILAGCGTSIGPKTQIQGPPGPTGPYDTPQNVAAYQQAISGFLSASSKNKVQALLFPVLTPSNPTFNDFMTSILPNISGVSVSMPWSEIETSQGNYDFSLFDASLQPYEAAGAQVNLIVWPATEGGNNDPNSVGSTPAYVFTPQWASSVGALNPQDMAVCASYTGDSSNPFYSEAASGSGGGMWNINTSGDLSGLPVSYELPFMIAYQKFIAQVVAHYNGNAATPIGYIRFGFSQGGEDSPECNQYWPGYSETVYLTYVGTMTNVIKAQNPSMTILADLHAVGPPGSVDYTYPDTEAADAVADGFGIGTNGLQQSDAASVSANQPCDSNWCALFSQYSGRGLTLSLQTLQWSDPTDVLQTGSLATLNGTEGLIPLAQAHGANNLELYLADVALAFSSDYCNYPHAVCGP